MHSRQGQGHDQPRRQEEVMCGAAIKQTAVSRSPTAPGSARGWMCVSGGPASMHALGCVVVVVIIVVVLLDGCLGMRRHQRCQQLLLGCALGVLGLQQLRHAGALCGWVMTQCMCRTHERRVLVQAVGHEGYGLGRAGRTDGRRPFVRRAPHRLRMSCATAAAMWRALRTWRSARGSTPVSSSTMLMPRLHTSHLGVCGCLRMISGAMYSGVPMYCFAKSAAVGSPGAVLRGALHGVSG